MKKSDHLTDIPHIKYCLSPINLDLPNIWNPSPVSLHKHQTQSSILPENLAKINAWRKSPLSAVIYWFYCDKNFHAGQHRNLL